MQSNTLSAAAIKKATGKSRDEWIALLTKIKAETLSHKEIAAKLYDDYNVKGWWAQMLTVEFERSIGRREVGQSCEGDFGTSVNKTLAGTMDSALSNWQKLVGDRREFDGVAFAHEPNITETLKWRYWRVSLADNSKININIMQKNPEKAAFSLQHEKLQNQNDIERWKKYWKTFLTDFS